MRKCWLRIDQSRKCLYKKGVLFIRGSQEGEGPTVRAGAGACAPAGSGAKPSLVGPRGQPSSAGCRNLRGPGLAWLCLESCIAVTGVAATPSPPPPLSGAATGQWASQQLCPGSSSAPGPLDGTTASSRHLTGDCSAPPGQGRPLRPGSGCRPPRHP